MTFFYFMMKKYKNGDGAKRDLACDMYDDKEQFPRNGLSNLQFWHKGIREYLENQGACDDCLDVFEKCWKEYIKCLKKSSSVNL